MNINKIVISACAEFYTLNAFDLKKFDKSNQKRKIYKHFCNLIDLLYKIIDNSNFRKGMNNCFSKEKYKEIKLFIDHSFSLEYFINNIEYIDNIIKIFVVSLDYQNNNSVKKTNKKNDIVKVIDETLN